MPWATAVYRDYGAGLEALDEAVGQGTLWVAENGFHLKLGEDPPSDRR
jgi:hypothetical protein